MVDCKFVVLLCSLFGSTFGEVKKKFVNQDIVSPKDFVIWKLAVVPYYINPKHFDDFQIKMIHNTMTQFAMKTCIQFSPVQCPSKMNHSTLVHTLVLENPKGIRKCIFNVGGHSIDGPHKVSLGYDCLKSPDIDMIIMRTLGFPFEHNRAVRDLYIEVLEKNIEPGAMDLFTKGVYLPKQMRGLPYDYHSVTHFGPRDFSKNGHRTIIFKNPSVQQRRNGLTTIDLRKIDIVYGPECRIRDRQAQLKMCSNLNFKGDSNVSEVPVKAQDLTNVSDTNDVDIDCTGYERNTTNPLDIEKTNETTGLNLIRRKRDVSNPEKSKNLRINRDISPPASRRQAVENEYDSTFVEKNISWNSEDKDDDTKDSENSDSKIQNSNNDNKYPNIAREHEEVDVRKSKEDEENDEKENQSNKKKKQLYERDEQKDKKGDSEENVNLPPKEKSSEAARNVPKTIQLTKENKKFYADRKWPESIIRYKIEKLFGYDLDSVRSRLNRVIEIIHEKTCVRFEEIDIEDKDEDYIVLDDSPDFVTGRVGGRQNFGVKELFEGGHHTQHTAMIVMAMLGFYFEVARHDRDNHIKIYNKNIIPSKLHHFEKISEEATFNLPYDYQSATHPACKFWRKPGVSGISTLATFKSNDPDGKIMKNLGLNPDLLSETDIIKINSVYGVSCFQKSKT